MTVTAEQRAITDVLGSQLRAGVPGAVDQLIPLVYEELARSRTGSSASRPRARPSRRRHSSTRRTWARRHREPSGPTAPIPRRRRAGDAPRARGPSQAERAVRRGGERPRARLARGARAADAEIAMRPRRRPRDARRGPQPPRRAPAASRASRRVPVLRRAHRGRDRRGVRRHGVRCRGTGSRRAGGCIRSWRAMRAPEPPGGQRGRWSGRVSPPRAS